MYVCGWVCMAVCADHNPGRLSQLDAKEFTGEGLLREQHAGVVSDSSILRLLTTRRFHFCSTVCVLLSSMGSVVG